MKIEELTALEIFNRLKEGHWFDFADKYFDINPGFKMGLDIIEKALKAFEIINEKSVCIATLKDSNSLEEYNDVICYHKVRSMTFEKPIPLTQEEYDLLKEMLLCG